MKKYLPAFPLLFLLLAIVAPVSAQTPVIDSLRELLKTRKDTARISILFRITDEYLNSEPKKAIGVALEARKIAEDAGDQLDLARAIGRIGQSYYNTGNSNMALKSFSEAKEIYEKMERDDELAATCIQIAEVKRDQALYQDALQKIIDAYNIYEKHNDKKGMARALNNSGLIYDKLQDYTKAITDYERSMQLRKVLNDQNGVAACLNNLANVYSEQGKFDQAIENYKQALDIRKNSGNKNSIAKALNNLGAAYFDKKEYDQALDYFLQALEIRKEIGDKRGMASSLSNLGSVNMNQGRVDKAIEYFNRAITLAEETGARDIESSLYESFAEAYEQKNEPAKALMFYKMFALHKDSMFNSDLAHNVAEMQARFDVEKAELVAKKAESDSRMQQLENDKITSQKRFIIVAAVISGVLLLIIVGILFNRALVRKRINHHLEKQKQEIEEKNSELQSAYHEIEEKNKDITDSIRYAKRLQEAILPEAQFAETFGSNGFVLYRPKDIVSGDFYWMEQAGDYLLFAAVDCTGHGVPGAFVSIVCSNLLNQSVKEHGLHRPSDILNDVNAKLSQTLHQRTDESRVRDGMDIALCCLNRKTLVLEFAGAFNPLYLIRGGELKEITSDKFSVGAFIDEDLRQFSHHELQLEQGDQLYLFSDGYADQFGGPKGKKFKRSRFKELLLSIQQQPLAEQKNALNRAFEGWRGRLDQVDDVLVMGVKIA